MSYELSWTTWPWTQTDTSSEFDSIENNLFVDPLSNATTSSSIISSTTATATTSIYDSDNYTQQYRNYTDLSSESSSSNFIISNTSLIADFYSDDEWADLLNCTNCVLYNNFNANQTNSTDKQLTDSDTESTAYFIKVITTAIILGIVILATVIGEFIF